MAEPATPSPEIVLNAGSAASPAVVLLHGKGMRPDALRPFAASRAMLAAVSVPAGPLAHGDGTHSWWAECDRPADLVAGASGQDLFASHPQGRIEGRAALAAAIARLRCAQPGRPVALVGFSQGGMVALDHLLLDGDAGIAGLALLSSSCIALDEWRPRRAAVRGLPVLIAHGRSDAELSFAAGERLRDLLTEAGAGVRWLPFDGGHEMPLVVWRGVARLLQDVANLPK